MSRSHRSTFHSVVRFLIGHAVAMALSLTALFVLPVGLVLGGIVAGNDPGGPMFLPIFVMGTALGAVVIGALLLSVSVGLQLLGSFRPYAWWIPAACAVAVAGLLGPVLLAVVGTADIVWVALAIVVLLAFAIYWALLSLVQKLVDRLWLRPRSPGSPSASPAPHLGGVR